MQSHERSTRPAWPLPPTRQSYHSQQPRPRQVGARARRHRDRRDRESGPARTPLRPGTSWSTSARSCALTAREPPPGPAAMSMSAPTPRTWITTSTASARSHRLRLGRGPHVSPRRGTGRGGRQHRGAGNGYRWCGPMGSGHFEQAQSLSDLATRVGSSHGFGLNYGNLLDSRRTIEYRYFDSSLDPARLQANIKLACWVTKRASTLPDSAIPQSAYRLGTHAGGGADRAGRWLAATIRRPDVRPAQG